MDSVPGFKQLVELLNWILVSYNDFLAGQGLGPDWSWGLAIIGLTITVRLILFPLTWKQFSSAQAMQAIQPRIKELQRKHKGNREKLQQETMKLYQEHRVNPFASCLPLILQLPVFIGLYYAIRGTDYLDPATTQQLADAGFLWVKSVAAGGGGLGLPDPTHILLVLYVVTQLISTELMLVTQTDKTQKMIMRSMPIIFIFILWRFPAGLFFYWVTTNLWTIGQQLIIRKVMKPFDLTAASSQPEKKRSRVVDALVSAQDQSDKGGPEGGTKKAGSGAQARGRSGQKQTKSGQKTGGTPAKSKNRSGAKPGSGQGASGSAGKSGGKRATTRSGNKPPPGKGKKKGARAGAQQSAGGGLGKPAPDDSQGAPPQAPEAPEAPELGTSASSPPDAPDSGTNTSGPVES